MTVIQLENNSKREKKWWRLQFTNFELQVKIVDTREDTIIHTSTGTWRNFKFQIRILNSPESCDVR